MVDITSWRYVNEGVFLFLPLFDFYVNLGWEEQELWIR